MKAKYLALGILLTTAVALIALRPSPHTTPAAPVAPTLAASTSPLVSSSTVPDNVTVNEAPKPPRTPLPEPSATTTTAPAPNITLTAGADTFYIRIADGATVLDAMQIAASSTSFTYTGHDYPGMGVYVDSINGKQNGSGYYWFLYVNGVSSETGASQTVLHSGDVVEWRYEKSS